MCPEGGHGTPRFPLEIIHAFLTMHIFVFKMIRDRYVTTHQLVRYGMLK